MPMGPSPVGPKLLQTGQVSPFGPHPSRSRDKAQQSRAAAATDPATQKSEQIQAQINAINQEGNASINQLKEDYEQALLSENARDENQIETEKTKGYERLREIQRQIQIEQQRIKRRGTEESQELKDYYQDQVIKARRGGESALQETQSKNFQQYEFERAQEADALDQLRKQNATQLEEARSLGETKIARINEENRKAYEERREIADHQIERTTHSIDERQNRLISSHQEAENRITRESNRQLEALRADTARKLSAYQERQSDPFYKMVTIDADLVEESDRFVLRANIPQFEQPLVKVTVSNDRLLISGVRRNEEQHDISPGRTQSTHSFQSFSESFPLTSAVEARQLSRTSEGDTLIITLPKKVWLTGEPPAHAPSKAPAGVKKATIERPRFPPNLPHLSDPSDAQSLGDQEEKMTSKSKAEPGSQTLT